MKDVVDPEPGINVVDWFVRSYKPISPHPAVVAKVAGRERGKGDPGSVPSAHLKQAVCHAQQLSFPERFVGIDLSAAAEGTGRVTVQAFEPVREVERIGEAAVSGGLGHRTVAALECDGSMGKPDQFQHLCRATAEVSGDEQGQVAAG